MGMFDLRCAVSGLPTSWTRNEDEDIESTCSQVLLEEVDGLWLPLTPPISGVYDNYGRIELWESMVSDHNTHVCDRLDALRTSGKLTLSRPEEFKKKTVETELYMDGSRRRRPRLNAWMTTSAEWEPAMHIADRPVRAMVYVDVAADAVKTALTLRARDPHETQLRDSTAPGAREVLADWFEEKGRVALARFIRAIARRGTFGVFGAPHASFDLDGFLSLLEWIVERPNGLRPTELDDAGQFSEEEEETFAREAAVLDPLLEKLVAERLPDSVARWRAEGLLSTKPAAQVSGRPYRASERFVVGDVVSHPTFGLGVVEELKAPNKVVIVFGLERKTLVHARQ